MKVTFVSPSGLPKELEVAAGITLRDAALDNNIEGIAGDCGGCASCSTCHVYVRQPYADQLPALGEHEDGMLDNTAADRLINSRLSCQIKLTDELDGITVDIPDRQF